MRELWKPLLNLFLVVPGVAAIAVAEEPDRFSPLDVFQLEFVADPQISPEGERIVYSRNSFDIMKDRRISRVWIVGFDGSDHRQLIESEGVSQVRFSPDGNRLAYVADYEDTSQIFVRHMDTGQTQRLTRVERAPRSLAWSPDGEWIAFSSHVPEPPPSLVTLPAKPKGAEWAEPPIMVERLRNRADGVGYLEPGYSHLFIVPSDGGTARRLTSGSFHHRAEPVWSPDSSTLFFSTNRNEDWEHEFRNSEVYALDVRSGAVTALTERSGPDHSPSVSPDGRSIAFVGYDDRVQTYQVSELWIMDVDGKNKRSLTQKLDRSVSSPQWDANGEGVFFLYDSEGNTKLAHVNLQGEIRVLGDGIGGTSYGRPYGGGSFTVANGGRYAVTLTSPSHPADLAVGSFEGEEGLTRLTTLNADLLDHKTLGEVEELWWDSSFDSRRIQGWLVKPPDFDPERVYPLILEIHGGPVSNYGDRFSAEIQLMASAGYLVLYANPRGSTSYGAEFGNLIYHNYPGEDYDDLISGVDAVLSRGYVDRDNLFVTGGSAGGIMTAWIVGKTNMFRAAVAAKPVINWYSKVLVADNYYGYHRYRYPGSPWENPEAYMKFSPISLVGNVETPTMLLTGDRDLRTPLSESEQFFHALKLRRIDTAMVRIPGASHNIVRRPSHLIAKIAYVLGWFEKYRTR